MWVTAGWLQTTPRSIRARPEATTIQKLTRTLIVFFSTMIFWLCFNIPGISLHKYDAQYGEVTYKTWTRGKILSGGEEKWAQALERTKLTIIWHQLSSFRDLSSTIHRLSFSQLSHKSLEISKCHTIWGSKVGCFFADMVHRLILYLKRNLIESVM